MDPAGLIALIKRMRELQQRGGSRVFPGGEAITCVQAERAVNDWLTAWDEHEAARGDPINSILEPRTLTESEWTEMERQPVNYPPKRHTAPLAEPEQRKE